MRVQSGTASVSEARGDGDTSVLRPRGVSMGSKSAGRPRNQTTRFVSDDARQSLRRIG